MTPAMLGAGLTCAMATTVSTNATNDDTSTRCPTRRFARSCLSARTTIVSAMWPFLPDTVVDDRSVHRPDSVIWPPQHIARQLARSEERRVGKRRRAWWRLGAA